MGYFSIDDSIENIKNPYTKELFKEVYSSYAMGNYRSATVMLWSVVVTDLVHKLNELDSIYNDPKALQILDYIRLEQQKDSKSSKWESEIVDKFHKEIKFFETFEVANLEHLQKMRHVSAHPVITSTDLLHSPTKETVYSLIRNALESVLTKEALFSSKIIEVILKDLNNIKDTLVDYEERDRYFSHKFLSKMPNAVLLKFLKTLWKFIFRIDNPETLLNTEINLDILNIIISKKKQIFIEFLIQDKDYISDIKLDDNLKKSLLIFLLKNRWCFEYFSENSVQTISKIIESSDSRFQLIKFKRIVDYIDFLIKNKSNYSLSNFEIIESEAEEYRCKDKFYDYCIDGYCFSGSFDSANYRFDKLIRPYLENFSFQQLKNLTSKANQNSQCYDRAKAKRDHKIVIEKILENDSNYDFTGLDGFTDGNEELIPSLT
nr:hypothetical protein [uncultured Acinetobacter sp.]